MKILCIYCSITTTFAAIITTIFRRLPRVQWSIDLVSCTQCMCLIQSFFTTPYCLLYVVHGGGGPHKVLSFSTAQYCIIYVVQGEVVLTKSYLSLQHSIFYSMLYKGRWSSQSLIFLHNTVLYNLCCTRGRLSSQSLIFLHNTVLYNLCCTRGSGPHKVLSFSTTQYCIIYVVQGEVVLTKSYLSPQHSIV